MSHFWRFGPYLEQVRNSEPFRSHWKWAYFLQGPRQQSNVEECAWWIQEGARPSQLIAPLKLFKKSGKKYLWFAGNIISTINAWALISTANALLITWSRRRYHVTNSLQSEQPNSHFSEQGKCHHHGWSKDPLLFWLKSSNTSNSFNSPLLLRFVPRGGRKRVFLRILPGLASLSKQSDFLNCNFQVFKSSERGGWSESPPSWQRRHVSFISYFSAQKFLKQDLDRYDLKPHKLKVEKHGRYVWCGCGLARTAQPLCDGTCQVNFTGELKSRPLKSVVVPLPQIYGLIGPPKSA